MLLHDIRHAFRSMRRTPGLTAAVLLTLALAIGVNTGMFSLVYGVLLRPLPYAEADRLVRLSELHPGGTPLVRESLLSNLTYDAWSSAPKTLDALAVYSSRAFNVTSAGEPHRLTGASISPGLFALLGTSPALGRFFHEDEGYEGSSARVILSDGLWRRRFGAARDAIGRTVEVDGRPHVIVGVTRPAFYFPDRDAELWTPYVRPRARVGSQASVSVLFALGRLKPGTSAEQAAAEGTAAARSVARPPAAELLFGKGRRVEVRVRRMVDEITLRIRPALIALMAAVGLVLLVACANVANLFLARGIARERELSIRAALGAGTARLVRLLLTESIVVASIGGAAGVFLAWALTHALPSLAPDSFPRLDDVRLDPAVLAFAALVTAVAGIVSGTLPAVRGAHADVASGMRTTTSAVAGPGGPTRMVLLGAEAALAVVLVIGAALLVRSFVALTNVDQGFDPRNVLAARVYLTGAASEPERAAHATAALAERVRSLPGVTAAGVGNMAPLGESSFVSGFMLRPGADSRAVMARALTYVITPGYAEALGLKLRHGRFFQQSDVTAAADVMLVNDAFAKTYLHDGRPVVGRRLDNVSARERAAAEIVGIVADVLKDGPDATPQPEIYLVHGAANRIRREINLIVRTAGDPVEVMPALRAAVREVEPSAAIGEAGPLAVSVAHAVSEPRFVAAILAGFAGLALTLAATGLYGVLSYGVSQRRRELGVRAALGATRGDLVSMIVRQGLTVTIAGLAAGTVVAAFATRAMERLLFGITALDVPSFAIAPLLLLTVAVFACLFPARRAGAADPAEALRAE